jgi:hypothetical protein
MDRVELKDGSVLNCLVIEETKDKVILSMGGTERKFSRSLVKSISFGKGQPATDAPEAVPGSSLDAGLVRQYAVPESELASMRQQGIPDKDLPLVFFIAAKARVAPGAVVKLRLKGLAWIAISQQFSLAPETFYYVPFYDAYPPASVLFGAWPDVGGGAGPYPYEGAVWPYDDGVWLGWGGAWYDGGGGWHRGGWGWPHEDGRRHHEDGGRRHESGGQHHEGGGHQESGTRSGNTITVYPRDHH